MDLLSIVAFLLISCTTINAHKILILFPSKSFSHQQPIMILTEALVNRGHQVFVVSPNVVPGLKENYTHVDISLPGVKTFQRRVPLWEYKEYFRELSRVPGLQLKNDAFLKFQRRVKDEQMTFDLVIGEAHLMPYVCGMARHLASGKPIIAMTTLARDFLNEAYLGNIGHLSYQPFGTPFSDRMSWWQKLYNWFVGTYMFSECKGIMEESAREFFERNYGPKFGSFVDGCWANVSLSMIASNFLYYYPRPLTPNVVELGPMHIRQPQKLPQVLQDWMDGAEKGVIYFSLGSTMKSVSMSSKARSNLLRFFKDLPAGYRVLWKWELDGPIPNQSDNILAQKWFPQQSVLAHPKVILFITHGGLQSLQETIHYGVPTVGIPWFSDQEANVAKMVASKIGTRLMPQDLDSFEKIKSAVGEVLRDRSYMKTVQKLSSISHDFTGNAVDKAVFWVEHVAKHGGTSHLRPSTADATYFHYCCLDLLSVILVIGLIIVYIPTFIFKFVTKSSCLSPRTKLKEL